MAFDVNKSGYQFDVGVPAGWSISPQHSKNTQTIVNISPGASGAPSAHAQIIVQPRLDHEDALQQIREFSATVRKQDKEFLQIGGWPAMQFTRVESRPPPDNAPALEHLEVLRIKTYIAAGDTLVIVSSSIPVNSSTALIQELRGIARSLSFLSSGSSQVVNDEIKALETAPDASHLVVPDNSPKHVSLDTTPVNIDPDEGANDRINTSGMGELEVAVSPDGVNVVVALQGRRWVSSNNGGATFPNGGQLGQGNGDPSVAWGQSGKFYIAYIDNSGSCANIYRDPVLAPDLFPPAGPDPSPNGLDCTGFARSDDNGMSFQTNTVNPSWVCIANAPTGSPANPGQCFPDQEHIAADRWNPGDTANDDQVYSTWRNFDQTDQDAGLVCSSDSGVTWTESYDMAGGEVFPRITVGQDGFVYVATYDGANHRLWKFTSCVDGLDLVGGFPVNVQARDPFQCPFAGHDRCDQNPTSQTVIVSDTDPDHVFYAFADDRGNGITGDSDIIVRDSRNGGASWPLIGQIARANEDVGARRIFPWLCATGGDAVVTWYEQRGARPTDTTDVFGARVGLTTGDVLAPMEEFVLSEVSDDWCDTGWRRATRWGNTATQTDNASEACPDQPQLAGACGDGVAGTADSGIRCDFSDDDGGANVTNCPAGELCIRGGGSPKYGDYNGNACTGGKLFVAFPSANAPDGLAPPDSATNPGVLFDVINLSDLGVPVITVPGSVHFGDVCEGDTFYEDLEVCNTGSADLQVDVITSDNPDFAVTVPSSGFPVTISKDFCFPFEVAYTPTGEPDTAILTLPSNDPDRPSIEVAVDASAGEQNLVTVMDSNYGDICLGSSNTQQLTLLNDGDCDLSITDVSIVSDPGNEFNLATVMSFPFVLKSGESVDADVEFTPVGDVGVASAQIEIDSDDPDTATKTLDLAGNSPAASISTFVADSGAFGDVCAADLFDLNLTVENTGTCPLELDSVAIVLGANAQAGDFLAPDGNADGTVIAAASSVQIPIRFTPSAFDNEPPLVRNASVDVTSHTFLASSPLAPDSTPVTGVVPPPDINLAIANDGNFGNVCKGDIVDLNLTLFNQGKCDLAISNIELVPPGGSFILPSDLDLPLVLSPDADFNYPVRYAPENCNDTPEAAQIKVTSDDPDEMMEFVDISGTSPCPNLVIDPLGLTGDFAFPATVMDLDGSLGCYSERTTVLRNNGLCPLTIIGITSSAVDEYTVQSPSVFPVVLPSGEETLGVTVRFTPQSAKDPLAPDEYLGELTVVSDDPDGDATAELCGEGVARSGIRTVVTDTTTGLPITVDSVDSMTVKTKGKKTPSPINLQFTDVTPIASAVCGNNIEWHLNLETLPATQTTGAKGGKSQYETYAREGNLQDSRTFSLGQCEFSEFQLQIFSSDGDGGDPPACQLKLKGESCSAASECCSGKCKGQSGNKTCK